MKNFKSFGEFINEAKTIEVTDMYEMFKGSRFNGDISNWTPKCKLPEL